MLWSDLETFALSVEEGSLTRAARRLYVTQPAISARLRRLEREVGEPLLRRSGQGVQPTAAGNRLMQRIAGLLEEFRRLEHDLRGIGPLQGRLAVGATDLVAIYHLPAVLRRLRRRHPMLEISIQVEGTANLLGLLQAGRVELGVGTLPVAEGRWETVPLYRDPLVVLAPPGHRLAHRKGIDPAALAAEAWISHKPDSVTRRLVDGFFRARGVELRVEMETTHPEAIKKLVQEGLGLAVLPRCAVRREVTDGRLSTLPIRGFRLERVSGLILRQNTPLSRAAVAFRAALTGQER